MSASRSSSASISFFSQQGSVSNTYEDQSSSASIIDSARSAVVQAWKPVKPSCTFLVKGGGVDDCGAEYTLSYEEKFHQIYMDYATKVGVQPRDLRLVHRNHVIDPNSTPFDNRFHSREVVLAYDEDLLTPLSVKVNHSWNSELLVFTIHDMLNNNLNERRQENKLTKVSTLYEEWAADRGVSADDVSLYLRGKSLDAYAKTNNATIEEAGISDGATLYGRWEEKGGKGI